MKPLEATMTNVEQQKSKKLPKKDRIIYITKENYDSQIDEALSMEDNQVILDLTNYNGSISNVIFMMQSNKVKFTLNNPHLLYNRVNHKQFKERIKQLTSYRIKFSFYKPKINCLLALVRYNATIRIYRFHMGFVAKRYRKLKKAIHKLIYGDMR